MKRSLRLIAFVFLLMVVSLACALPGGLPTDNPLDTMGTQVAATVTALSQLLSQGVTEAPATLEPMTPSATVPPLPAVLRVAYVRDNNAWVWTEGGLPLQLTMTADVQDAVISPDGQIVAYVRQTGAFSQEIWAVDQDGGNSRLLVSSADFMATFGGDPADSPSGIGVYKMGWQPGSHNLYYNTRPIYEGPGSFSYDDLRMVNADTLAKQSLFDGGLGGKFFFSPDGSQVAIVRPTSISLVNSDGSNLRPSVIVYSAVITYSEYLYYPTPVWAPDSNSLRVVIPPADPLMDPMPPYTLWLIHAEGSPAVTTGTIPAIPFDWPDSGISPDTNRLGYIQTTGGGADPNMRDIKLANADGSGVVWYLSGDGAQFLGWLPNSAQFVFKIFSGPDVGVHVSSLAEGYFTLSPDPSQVRAISWTDDTHYLGLWQNAGVTELRYNILGGGTTLIDSGQIWGYNFSN